jgi:uncharacterized DUF497 family protein
MPESGDPSEATIATTGAPAEAPDSPSSPIQKREEPETEDRFILLGLSAALRVLFVCHCVRESGSLIRIISARRANQSEAKQYTERLRK